MAVFLPRCRRNSLHQLRFISRFLHGETCPPLTGRLRIRRGLSFTDSCSLSKGSEMFAEPGSGEPRDFLGLAVPAARGRCAGPRLRRRCHRSLAALVRGRLQLALQRMAVESEFRRPRPTKTPTISPKSRSNECESIYGSAYKRLAMVEGEEAIIKQKPAPSSR